MNQKRKKSNKFKLFNFMVEVQDSSLNFVALTNLSWQQQQDDQEVKVHHNQ